MSRDDIVYDKLNMLLAVGSIDKKAFEKASDIYEWMKVEYPSAKISSMMISHIAVVMQRVLDGKQIDFAEVEYKMPLSDEQLYQRNSIIKRIKQSVRIGIDDAEINYLDVHIRNFIYDNL